MRQAAVLDVAIVGAGMAGSALAAELARRAPAVTVGLFDPAEPGPGNAYATPLAVHRMNGPVRAMSAVPGDDRHLQRWLASEPPEALIERRVYAGYLRALVAEAAGTAPGLQIVRAEITDLIAAGEGFELVASSGTAWQARAVVLALGNAPPRSSLVPPEVAADPRYLNEPWRFDGRGVRGEVLCIGSGLTALDVVAALDAQEFDGRVHLVSRHALVPLLEDPAVRASDPAALELDTASPYRLLRSMRRAARRVVAADGDWRAVVEAIRRSSPAIWESWDLRERRRFLRHLEAYWSIHRYRVPPPTAEALDRIARAGRLVRHRGSVRDVRSAAGRFLVRFERAGVTTRVAVDRIVNCTGPESDYRRNDRPLVRNLLRRGLIRADELGLGIDATAALRVVGAHGAPWPSLYTLGPPLRGLWYETTGVPEIRRHAGTLAATLVAALC